MSSHSRMIILAFLLLFPFLVAACDAQPSASQPSLQAPTVEEISPTEIHPSPRKTAVPTDTLIPSTTKTEPTATAEPSVTSVPPSEPDTTAHDLLTPLPSLVGGEGWSTVAGNVERTSWTDEEVAGHLQLEWYRPIEAYIPQNVQIIASNGILYIATASGLYALHAVSGDTIWRFDTEMPLGNSPTVADGVVYIGGYDRKLHAVDAVTGTHLWSFDGADAGYDTNPLVVDDKVILGNRDGNMYAIGAHGTANQGQLLWSYATDDPIHLSAAYKDGVVYFASNDNYAYALNANKGTLVWKSNKMPGQQFQSYWPVIYDDKVIFAMAHGYRQSLSPGTKSVTNDSDQPYSRYNEMQKGEVFAGEAEGTTLGPEVASQAWAHGYPVIDASRMTEYLEDNPNPLPHRHVPWRRVFVVLNRSDGSEYTFDSDGDGYPEYMPAAWWGTGSGNRFPPIVGADGILYFSNLYQCCSDAKGRVMGWLMGTPYLSVMGGFGAVAEPQALSAGGDIIYRNLCCDRVADWFNYMDSGDRGGGLWSYDLNQTAPDYDMMWTTLPGWPRLQGWYKGDSNSINAAYHNHGDQNPLVPYEGRIYTHRSNAIIAYGTNSGPGQKPLLTINPPQANGDSLTESELTARLEDEIGKMIAAGHLRPGYYNPGQFVANLRQFSTYYDNPGDTLYALSIAYPHLSAATQTQLAAYIQQEFDTYFDSEMVATIGWSDGAPREAMLFPPEVKADFANYPPNPISQGFGWRYPPHNFYAMWKYAEIFPVEALHTYNLAKGSLLVPVPDMITDDYFEENIYVLNAYITGYIGFLELQELAGMSDTDSSLRTQVTNELNRLLTLRVNVFSKDSPWVDERYHKKHLDISRNFIWMAPELAGYLYQNVPHKVDAAVAEYNYIAPYWFVSRFESSLGEDGMSSLYNYYALFQAKAYARGESQGELSKYIDVPAFARGDLYYIMNLVAALEAP